MVENYYDPTSILIMKISMWSRILLWPAILGLFRATSHTRLSARDHHTSSTLIGGKGGAGPSLIHTTTLEGPTEYISELQDRCKVYMDPYMARNGSCFMDTWIIFKNHLLEVRLPQNRWETMTLRRLTTVGLFGFIKYENPHEKKFIEIAFG